MEYSTTTAEQELALETAKMMLYMQQCYDFTLTTRPSKMIHASIAGAAGENIAGMLLVGLKQCTKQSLEQIQVATDNLRRRRRNFFTSREFRQACKLYLHEWGQLESSKRYLGQSDTSVLMLNVNRLSDLILSPLGAVSLEDTFNVYGRTYPVHTATFSGANLEDRHISHFYRQLSYFTGILDWLDETSAHHAVEMIPRIIVPPNWYYQGDVSPSWSVDNHVELHEELCERYTPLSELHNIQINDGFCQSIQIAEFEGKFGAIPYRLMVGSIQFQEINGWDVYLALQTPYFCRTQLLVSQEAADGIGPCVIRQVYHAYAQALKEETGEQIDIDDLIEELEEAVDSHELW